MARSRCTIPGGAAFAWCQTDESSVCVGPPASGPNRGTASATRRIRRLLADEGYGADGLRADLRQAGTRPVIPGTRSRNRPIRYDKMRDKDRWRAEAVFCRLKDFRLIAIRYDRLARNSASAAALAAVVAFWCRETLERRRLWRSSGS